MALGVAVVATVVCLLSGIGFLGSLFLTLPAWALAVGPAAGRRRTLVLVVALGLAAGGLRLIDDLSGATTDGYLPVWPGILIRAWVTAGLVWMLAAAIRRWRVLVRARVLRLAGVLVLPIVWLAVILPLPLVYHVPKTLPSKLGGVEARVALPGVTLHTRGYSAAQGPTLGSGPWGELTGNGVLVLVPGMGDSIEEFENRVARITAHGWAVIGYDPRGCGRSTYGATTYGTLESQDLVDLWPQVQVAAAGRPLAVYGISLGGAAVALASDRLDGLGLLISESSYDVFAELPAVANQPGPILAIGGGLSLLATGHSPLTVRPIDAPGLQAAFPKLIGWCADDRLVPAVHTERLAAAASPVTSIARPDGSHLDLVDHEPWWQALTEALDQVSAR